jgi:uncharacterized membrane protein YfcA
LLALIGGFMDAVGGGGCTHRDVQHYQGKNPKETIGTVNTTEFLLLFQHRCIPVFVGVESWPIVLGLIIGGVVAAPIGAFFASRVNKRSLMILVGIVII